MDKRNEIRNLAKGWDIITVHEIEKDLKRLNILYSNLANPKKFADFNLNVIRILNCLIDMRKCIDLLEDTFKGL